MSLPVIPWPATNHDIMHDAKFDYYVLPDKYRERQHKAMKTDTESCYHHLTDEERRKRIAAERKHMRKQQKRINKIYGVPDQQCQIM